MDVAIQALGRISLPNLGDDENILRLYPLLFATGIDSCQNGD
jgi:hypothetical protein